MLYFDWLNKLKLADGEDCVFLRVTLAYVINIFEVSEVESFAGQFRIRK